MFKITIILIVVITVGIIGVFGGIFLSQYDEIKSITENDFLSTYDCAKNYDKMMTLRETTHRITDPSYNTWLAYSPYELMENRCFITVKSWAHQSDYEHIIWGTDWEHLSYSNQMYLGEIPCATEENCVSIKKQRGLYQEYIKNKN